MTLACVFGCAGMTVTDEEAAFFRAARPWGFILFGRNVATPDQVRGLVESLRSVVDRPDAPILIDQEGGRVRRLRPPLWPAYPPARAYLGGGRDSVAARALAGLGGRLIAHDLSRLGISVNCAPVADVPAPDGHEVIGDRAFGDTADEVGRWRGRWPRACSPAACCRWSSTCQVTVGRGSTATRDCRSWMRPGPN